MRDSVDETATDNQDTITTTEDLANKLYLTKLKTKLNTELNTEAKTTTTATAKQEKKLVTTCKCPLRAY